MENKQQTPLQRLIAELETSMNYYRNSMDIQTNNTDKGRSRIRLSQLRVIRDKAKDLLPYEREVIENAHEFAHCEYGKGKIMPSETEFKEASKEYYTQAFQTNE